MKRCLKVLTATLLISVFGCSTDRHYRATHEDTVEVATRVIAEETGVRPDQISVTEVREGSEGKGGRRTKIRAKYLTYSDTEVNVVSKPWNKGGIPEVEAKVTTNKILYTRHTDWEKRIIEKIGLWVPRLKGKKAAETEKTAEAPKMKPAADRNLLEDTRKDLAKVIELEPRSDLEADNGTTPKEELVVDKK